MRCSCAASCCVPCPALPFITLCREGDEADNFYVVESGAFEATKGGAHAASYEGCGSFGELALMYNCPRAATITGEVGQQ